MLLLFNLFVGEVIGGGVVDCQLGWVSLVVGISFCQVCCGVLPSMAFFEECKVNIMQCKIVHSSVM